MQSITKVLYEKNYGADKDGESWKVLRVGGTPQKIYPVYSIYDCSGQTFCSSVDSYLFGFITIGHYGIDV